MGLVLLSGCCGRDKAGSMHSGPVLSKAGGWIKLIRIPRCLLGFLENRLMASHTEEGVAELINDESYGVI